MPGLADLFKKSIQAGVQDDSFAMGYKSADARDLAKQESASALERLIKGKQMEQEALESNQIRAQQEAERMGLKPGKYSMNVSQGGFGVNPEGEGLAALLGHNARQQEREDRAVERFSDRVSKNKIPERAADFVNLEANTAGPKGGFLTDPDYKVKSAGLNNYIPTMFRGAALSAGEKLGIFEKGTSEEAQALQRLYNTEIRSNSGTAVAMHEQGRNDIAAGLKANNPELIKRGVAAMRRALELDEQNVAGSAPERVKGAYRAQGGEYQLSKMIPQRGVQTKKQPGGLSPEEQAELDALRKELGR